MAAILAQAICSRRHSCKTSRHATPEGGCPLQMDGCRLFTDPLTAPPADSSRPLASTLKATWKRADVAVEVAKQRVSGLVAVLAALAARRARNPILEGVPPEGQTCSSGTHHHSPFEPDRSVRPAGTEASPPVGEQTVMLQPFLGRKVLNVVRMSQRCPPSPPPPPPSQHFKALLGCGQSLVS